MKQFVRANLLVLVIILLGVVTASITTWAWWKHIYTDPEHVFDRMLSESLSAGSVTKGTIETTTGQTLNQTSQLTVTPTASVRTLTDAAQGNSSITTETIAYPDREYFRYTDIKTEQQDGSVTTPEKYQAILGTWGHSSAATSGTEAQLFDQTLLGVVPVAQLQPNQRAALIKQITEDKVYTVDYASMKRQRVDSREIYVYKVGINPRAYVKMLKTFAQMVGSKQLDGVDETAYPESPTLDVEMTIDVWSGYLQKVTYPDNVRTETFSAYGGQYKIDEPTDSIPLLQLQSQLQ